MPLRLESGGGASVKKNSNWVLDETVRIAIEKKFVTQKELSQVVVDTTVQEKNIERLFQRRLDIV